MCETTNENQQARSPLLPDRREQQDFFVCDIFDAAPKGDMASMEHPIFSISTKPDHNIRRYEKGKNYIEVKPGADGLATIHDRDVLIYCISQIMAAINQGRKVSQTLRFVAHELLTATNKDTGGDDYRRLKGALNRLAGTRIETNITTGDIEILDGFGLIEKYRIVRETRDGRMLEIEIKLSDWVFNAIQHKEVLTLNRNYFRLRKPLERRMYELARKHCGTEKQKWSISLKLLKEKCGSNSTLREFKRLVQKIIDQDAKFNHIPDYAVRRDGDNVVFHRRASMNKALSSEQRQLILLQSETYEDAKKSAPGWDIYYLEEQWRGWMKSGNLDTPIDPDKAFIGFCVRWFEKRGRPR